MRLENGFGLELAINGRAQREVLSGGSAYVIGLPGSNYTLRLFMPKGARYGLRLLVDGKLAYGQSQGNLASGIDMKDPSNDTENELPFFYADNQPAGKFKFANVTPGDANVERAGIIEATFFADASGVPYSGVRQSKEATRSSSRGASRGASRGDLHTEADHTGEQGSVSGDYGLSVYQIGEEIGTLSLNYATEGLLRQMGVIS